MDRLKDGAFDNLIAELRKKSFKGSPIDFIATKDTGHGYRSAHEIEILFKHQPAFRDLDPNYKRELNGRIVIEIYYDCYTIKCEYPSSLLLSVIDEVRMTYYRHERWNDPIKSFGCGYSDYKRITKTLQTADSVLKWFDKFIDLSYNSVLEGRAWWVSEPVQDDVKKYLESQKIRSEYDDKIGELEDKKDKEETRFNEYDRKYRDNFVRVRTAKSDF
jgi:hypothetical protein